MKVLFLSRYGRLGASSRLRSFKYIPYLEKHGIDVTVNSLLNDEYIKDLYAHRKKRKLAIIMAYLKRMALLFKAKSYDLIWIEKELFPFMPAFAERLLSIAHIPFIVDYDDAIFHQYDLNSNLLVRFFLGRKIDAVMNKATLVIAGNDYLAKRAHSAGAKWVEVLPTIVDLDGYDVKKIGATDEFVIGWIGTPKTQHYLYMVFPVLSEIAKKRKIRIVAVGAKDINYPGIDIETPKWSEKDENELIRSFDVGIMPLPDEPWERGKCGYKLIQYMACGLPVVASPVGVNHQIVENGKTGFLANSDGWESALMWLCDNREKAVLMGRAGRKKVEENYSIQVTVPKLLKLVNKICAE